MRIKLDSMEEMASMVLLQPEILLIIVSEEKGNSLELPKSYILFTIEKPQLSVFYS